MQDDSTEIVSDMEAVRAKLIELRDDLQRQRDEKQAFLAGFETAMQIVIGNFRAERDRSLGVVKAKGIKRIIIDLLIKQGDAGLTSANVVDATERSGVVVLRGTVSSLLSRLKADGLVTYDGDRYRLKAA